MLLRRITLATAALLLAGGTLAAPAGAEPMPPCEFGLSFLCSMLPVAPDLEGDIDLTQDKPPANSLPEDQVADPCALGCI
jgi:hypothetical protein